LRRPALEEVLSCILIIGVATSLIIEFIGLALYVTSEGTMVVDMSGLGTYVRSRNFFDYIIDVVASTLNNPNYANVTALGLMFLMLTQYLVVLASAVYFALSRNCKYVVITLVILVILTVSLSFC